MNNIETAQNYIIEHWNGEYLDCNGTKFFPYPAAIETEMGNEKFLIEKYWAFLIDTNGNILGSLSPIEMKPTYVPSDKPNEFSFTFSMPNIKQY